MAPYNKPYPKKHNCQEEGHIACGTYNPSPTTMKECIGCKKYKEELGRFDHLHWCPLFSQPSEENQFTDTGKMIREISSNGSQMKNWDELTKRQQDNFIRKHADEIFKCSEHGLDYKKKNNLLLIMACKECRDITRSRYGIYSAK